MPSKNEKPDRCQLNIITMQTVKEKFKKKGSEEEKK